MELDTIRMHVASPEEVRTWSSGEVLLPETLDWRTLEPVQGGLFCRQIFGPDEDRLGHIELAEPLENIWLRKTLTRLLGIPAKRLRKLMDRSPDEGPLLQVLPVASPKLRPLEPTGDGRHYRSSHLNELYRRVVNRNNRLRHLLELRAPDPVLDNERQMLQRTVDALLDRAPGSHAFKDAKTGRRLASLADHLMRRLRLAAGLPAGPAEAPPPSEDLLREVAEVFRCAGLELDALSRQAIARRLLRRIGAEPPEEEQLF
jgi:DNA-directed RNA polymerase beta' subunit